MLFTAYYENGFNNPDSIEDYAAVETIDAPTWQIALEKALLIGVNRSLELASIEKLS